MESCKGLEIEVEYTSKHYLQSNGKVECCIRTFNGEFLCLGEVLDGVDGLLFELLRWYTF